MSSQLLCRSSSATDDAGEDDAHGPAAVSFGFLCAIRCPRCWSVSAVSVGFVLAGSCGAVLCLHSFVG